MSAPLTFAEAKTRFAGLVTTKVTIGDAIQEALDRIFEMGRYDGTTEEIELTDADFIYDANLDETFLYFSKSAYSCAIAFRNDKRGWNIVNQAVLYREPVNEGDDKFVHMGTVFYDHASVTINPEGADNSFTITAVEAGEDGKNITFAMSMVVGTPIAVVVAGDALTVNAESATYATGGFTYDRTGLIDGDGIVVGAESWTFRDAPSGAYEISTATALADAAQAIVDAINAISTVVTATYDGFAGGLDSITITAIAPGTSGNAITLTGSPFNASGATLTGGTGTSISTAQQVIDAINGDAEAAALVTTAASGTVTGAVAAVAETALVQGSSNHRKYRCPQKWWKLTDGPFFAMMKLAAPTLTDSDTIPIVTAGALKHAVQAVSYEYLNDETLADNCWARFERAMSAAEPQSDGPTNQVGTPDGY